MNNDTYKPDSSGILIIHASAVTVNSKGLIFLGPSGSGKSTICRLSSPGAQPLADDALYMIYSNGKWAIASADQDLPGKLSTARATSHPNVPLRAISRLYQAPIQHLERVDALQTCRHLADALFEARWQRQYDVETKKIAFSWLAAAARSIPGFQLYFNLSPIAFELTDDKITLRQR